MAPVGEQDSNPPSEDLEAALEVLLTQAAKKRSALERARGFSTKAERGGETQAARERRIKDMKARMPHAMQCMQKPRKDSVRPLAWT